MNSYVIGFQDMDKSNLFMVGGKGTGLGELAKVEGIFVPESFCVTTEAYQKLTADNKELTHLLAELSHLRMEDRKTVGKCSCFRANGPLVKK